MAKQKRLTKPQWQAQDRWLVRLPDGRLGRLQYVTRNSAVATVLVYGRRVKVSYYDLEICTKAEYETFLSAAAK